MGGAAFAGGLLEGIGQGLAERRRRQDRLKSLAVQGSLEQIQGMLNDPDFSKDPAARQDIVNAYFDVLHNYTSGGKTTKGQGAKGKSLDPIDQAKALVGGIIGKAYPSGQGRPPTQPMSMESPSAPGLEGQPSQTTIPSLPGIPEKKGPFLAPGEGEAQRETAKGEATTAVLAKRERMLAQQENELRKSQYQDDVKTIENSTFLTPSQKIEALAERQRSFVNLSKAPMSRLSVSKIPGTSIADRVDAFGQPVNPKLDYELKDDKFYPQEPSKSTGGVAQEKRDTAIRAYADKHNVKPEDMTAAQIQEATSTGSELKGELANRAEAQQIIDNPTAYSSSQVKAAKDYQKSLDTKEKGAEVRIVTAQNTNAENQAVRQLQVGDPTGEQAKKLRARAAMDPSMDLAAWDWLAYEKFDVRGLGKNTQADVERIKMRAGQIMDDLGLSTGDIFSMRAGLKGNTTALSKITTTGAQIEQFENTLQRNTEVARKLSDAYKRSDFPLINRVVNAFKTGKGDSEALNLAAQLHGVSREWAKIMQGSTSAAGVTLSEAEQTDALISAALSKGQLDSLFDNVISVDAKNRTAAINDTKNNLLKQIKGVSSGTPPGATTPDSGGGPRTYKHTAGGGRAGSDDGVNWFDVKTGQPWK